MQRIIYILLLSLLYGICGIVNYVGESLSESAQPYQSQHLVEESKAADNDTYRLYDNDMLRTATPRCVVIEEASTIQTPSSSTRYRTSTTQKIMASAIPSRHAGHITRIFEFNHFTSSLRIGYYLYTLCRLRI